MAHLPLFRVFLLFQVYSLAIIGAKGDTYNCTIELDLAFVVDSSGSICNDTGKICESWKFLLTFMKDLVNDMTIGDKGIRVAMIEFDSSAVIMWNLTKYKDKTNLMDAIDKLPYIGGNTDTIEALDLLSTVFTTERGDRLGVGNTAILITDGKPRRGNDPIPMDEIRAAVKRVLDHRIRLLVVGVTDSIDMDTLKELSSPPHEIGETVFIAKDYENISKVKKQLENQTCINSTDQQQSTPAALCTEMLDLCFVVDESGSICDSDPAFNYIVDETCNNWKDNVEFIRAVADSFDVGAQATRIGLVIFSSTSVVKWHLTTYTDKGELLNAITSLVYHKGGTTDMTGGLNLMRTQVFGLSDDRPDVPNTAIFITDGYPTNPSTLEAEIVAVRNSGITTLVVGVTDKIDLSTIQRLAKQPPQEGETYFLAENYPALAEKVTSQLSTKACFTPTAATMLSPGSVSSPTTSTTTTSTTDNSTAASTSTTTATSTTISTSTTTTTATVTSATTVTPPASLIDISPTSNTGAPVCDDAALDLCFLVDESGSICDSDPGFVFQRDSTCNNWALIVNFLRNLVVGIFDSQVTRIGLVTFSTGSEVVFDLTRYTDKNELIAAVSNLTYVKGGTTDMTGALRLARTQVFNTAGDRQGFPNTAVMITDGRPTQPSTLQAEIDATHNSGIRVLALGVTKEVDENTLRRLSSPPQQIDVTYFMALNFVDIDSFRKVLQERICQRTP